MYNELEEMDFGPRLWDATPGVCCAAFQLGACAHTEGGDYGWDPTDEELAADAQCMAAWDAEQASLASRLSDTGEEPF